MTNRQIIKSLQQRGIKVSYYVRLDGSIRVTELGGVKYSSRLSEGNEAARVLYYELEGIERKAAEAKAEEALRPIRSQRLAAQRSRASGRTLKSQTKMVRDEFKALQNRVKRMDKVNQRQGKRGFESITWEKTREAASAAGITPAAQIARMMDYYEPLASDIAPRVMVNALIKKIKLIIPKYPYLADLLAFLEANPNTQDIYAIDKAGEVIYEVDATDGNQNQKTRNVEAMLDELKEKQHSGK